MQATASNQIDAPLQVLCRLTKLAFVIRARGQRCVADLTYSESAIVSCGPIHTPEPAELAAEQSRLTAAIKTRCF